MNNPPSLKLLIRVKRNDTRTASAETRLLIMVLREPKVPKQQPAFAKATAGESGERGIRTLGTGFPVRQFSKLFLSATQASLQGSV